MEKKYVVQIPEHAVRIVVVGIDEDGEIYTYGLSVCNLDSYTEPDLEQVRKEGYEKGYETGYEDGYNEPGKNQQEAYQRGLSDAWEAARKFMSEVIDARFRNNFMVEIFRWDNAVGAMKVYSASEAIEKIRQYEQEKDSEIKVGDEVQFKNTGSKFVVTRIFASEEGRKCEGLFDDGEVYERVLDGGNVEKTGRTCPEIAAVLEKMRGEQDG